jgi:type IV secretion system protein VirB9
MSKSRIACPGVAVLLALTAAEGPVHAQALHAGAAAVTLAVREDPVRAAYRNFERSGRAPIIWPKQDGGFVLYPFGHERPAMRCPRLNACMIALEPGERLTDEPLSGDTERWIITTSVMGSARPSPLVVVKPQACDIATNLLVPTNRRVYEVSLVSDRCEADESEVFTRQVSFWYPEQMRAEQSNGASGTSAIEHLEPPQLNRDYEIDRGWFLKRKRYAWIPSEVYDDGIRTYLVLPEEARTGELPILYLLEGDERQILNYALRGDTLVADRVLQRALLAVGTGDGERSIEIVNRNAFRNEQEER